MKTRKITENDLKNLPLEIELGGHEAFVEDMTVNGKYLVHINKLGLFSKEHLLANAMVKEEEKPKKLYAYSSGELVIFSPSCYQEMITKNGRYLRNEEYDIGYSLLENIERY